jgi:DNA-binding transcriptional regulator GbsR (MarR family)
MSKKRATKSAATLQETDAELNTLAGLVGDFIEYWGFKRIHGRMWTHLFVSGRPMDAGELIRRLDISKALASMTLKDLLAYEVVLPAGRSARGTDLFCANSDTMGVILNVLRKREQVLLGKITTAYDELESASKNQRGLESSRERLQELGSLIASARSMLDLVLAFKDSK